GLIELAPFDRELEPVDAADALLLAERRQVAAHARAPVHNGAEDVEQAGADLHQRPTARRSAARASSRVESSVGRGELASFMMSGISVQPSTTASQPARFIFPMTC